MAHGLSSSIARGIFQDLGWNLPLLHWQVDSLPLSYQGSPLQEILYVSTYTIFVMMKLLCFGLSSVVGNSSMYILSSFKHFFLLFICLAVLGLSCCTHYLLSLLLSLHEGSLVVAMQTLSSGRWV